MDESGVGRVIDPTKNVLDLFRAESAHRDALRAADGRYLELCILHQDSMRAAETRRRDELAMQRDRYEQRIAEQSRRELDNTTTLLATAQRDIKDDFSERTSKLEQFRWETGGKSVGMGSLWTGFLSIIALGVAAYAAFTR